VLKEKRRLGDNKPEQDINQCPTCNRPYYPYHPYPYYPVPENKRRPSKLGIIIVAIIVIFFFIMIVGSIILFSAFDNEWDTSEYSTTAIISSGGHFKYRLEDVYFDEMEIELKIYSEDYQYFDVYIMDEDQYDNYYGNENLSRIAFSAIFIQENITQLEDKVKFSDTGSYREYYLIIDNSDNPITQNDAVPYGVVNVNVELEVRTRYVYDSV
jgi:hypothetical protein